MKQKGKISQGKNAKSEDKAWNDWYEKLDVAEHEKYLAQLGLDKEDIEEWEEAEGFKKKPKVPKAKEK